MKRSIALVGAFAWLAAASAGQASQRPAPAGGTQTGARQLTGAYLGQPLPGDTPEVFAPGIVSSDANEHSAPSFSPDGNEVFWWANQPPGPNNKDWAFMSQTMRRENGLWSPPRDSSFGEMVAFSPDGRRVYFASRQDIWVAEKTRAGWGEPRCLNLVARHPELRGAFMPRATRNGTLYFVSSMPGPDAGLGIYRAELVNGEYARPQPLPPAINRPPFTNWAPFIAPDESYLLFSSNRRDPDHDGGDLYISRRRPDGSWSEPVSLGEPVNSPAQEVFPGLSPDGKYLFFCRDTATRQNDVYWVRTAGIAALRFSVGMPQAVNLVAILVLGVAPLYAALRRSRWSPGTIKWLMVAIPVLLFPLNAPLHEASHIVGTWLAGGSVGQVRLWQPFWRADAPVPMIETFGLTTPATQFVSSAFPYAVDAALLLIGAALLSRARIRSAWTFGAFFLFLVLKPSFDITANVVAWSVYGIGDFGQMAAILGGVPAGALQASLLAGGIGLTLAVIHNPFPGPPV